MNRIHSKILLLLFFGSTLNSFAQTDSTQRKSKVLGLAVAPVFSFASFRSEAYMNDTVTLAAPRSIQTPGLGVSFTFDIPITSRIYLRPGIETIMLPSKISFETKEKLQTTTQVVPMTIDIPIGIYYAPGGFSIKNTQQPKGIYFGAVARAVFPFQALLPIKPALNSFIPHADIIAGYHWYSGKSFKRMELFFSLALMDYMTHAETENQWRAVKHYYRNFGGVRVIFN
jgi:hypothetical protein